MSNIFRRLASQQLNPTSVRIRPMARLPFHNAPSFAEDEGSLVVSTNSGKTATATETAYEPIATQGLKPAAGPIPTPDGQMRERSSLSPLTPTSEPEHQATDSSGTLASETNPTASQFPESLIRPDNTPANSAQTAQAPAAPQLVKSAGVNTATIAVKESSISPKLSTAQPEKPSPQAQDANTRPQTPNIIAGEWNDTTANQLPAPLLPRHEGSKAKTATQQTGLKPQSSTNASKSAGAEPNEVHIHIGRIEVTALQPEAASKEQQKPRSRRGQQPMSLDDYLAKRQRGDR